MAIKNKDGSTYTFTKPPLEMEEQAFWDKKEKIIVHNKFGQRYLRGEIIKEMRLPEKEMISEKIQIIQAIEEAKPKPVSEGVVEIWCLPCLEYSEDKDPLYEEEYTTVKYGDTFIFRSRILTIEDLYIQFVTEKDIKIAGNSVIYPKMKNRRWWRIKGVKEIQGFNVYVAEISDYQPSFVD